jgi:hypothetical protein
VVVESDWRYWFGRREGLTTARLLVDEGLSTLAHHWKQAKALCELTGIEPTSPAYAELFELALADLREADSERRPSYANANEAYWSDESISSAVEAEREACAKLADVVLNHKGEFDPYRHGYRDAAMAIGKQIRARGEVKLTDVFPDGISFPPLPDGATHWNIYGASNLREKRGSVGAWYRDGKSLHVTGGADGRNHVHFATLDQPHDPTKSWPECCGGVVASPSMAGQQAEDNDPHTATGIALMQAHARTMSGPEYASAGYEKRHTIVNGVVYGIDVAGIYRCNEVSNSLVNDRAFASPIAGYLEERKLDVSNIKRVGYNEILDSVYYEWEGVSFAWTIGANAWSEPLTRRIDKGATIPVGDPSSTGNTTTSKIDYLNLSFDANKSATCSRCDGELEADRVSVCKGCEPERD